MGKPEETHEEWRTRRRQAFQSYLRGDLGKVEVTPQQQLQDRKDEAYPPTWLEN